MKDWNINLFGFRLTISLRLKKKGKGRLSTSWIYVGLFSRDKSICGFIFSWGEEGEEENTSLKTMTQSEWDARNRNPYDAGFKHIRK